MIPTFFIPPGIGVLARQSLNRVAAHQFYTMEHRLTHCRTERMLVRRKRDRSVLVSAERNLVSNRLCSRIRGLAFSQCLPLVQQGGVNRTNQRGQPIDDRLNLVRHRIVGNNLLHATICIRQITQQHAFGTSHVVTRNKLRECHRVLNHLTDN